MRDTSTRSLLRLLAAGSVLLATSAAAAPRRTAPVAVALDRRLEREALTVWRALDELVARDPRLVHVDAAKQARGGTDEARARRNDEARALLRQGVDLLDNMDPAGALVKLRGAIAGFEQGDLASGMPGLLEALAMSAAAHLADGDAAEAQNQLVRLFTLKPGHAIDPARLTPELAAAVESAKAQVEQTVPTVSEVQATPAPAHVWVDGAYRGVTPLELPQLVPGTHHVTLSAPGYELAQKRHLVAPGQVANVQLAEASDGRSLLARLEELKTAFIAGDPSAPGASLAGWANADEVLAAGVLEEQGALVVTAARVAKDGHVLNEKRQTLKGRSAAAMGALEELVRGLYAESRPRGPKPGGADAGGVGLAATAPDTAKVGSRTWAYVAIGGGVLAGAGGIALGSAAADKAEEARKIPQVDVGDYQNTVSSGKGLAVFADVLFLAAAVGLGTGAYLILSEPSEKPAPPPLSDEEEKADPDPFALVPQAIPGGAALSLEGAF